MGTRRMHLTCTSRWITRMKWHVSSRVSPWWLRRTSHKEVAISPFRLIRPLFLLDRLWLLYYSSQHLCLLLEIFLHHCRYVFSNCLTLFMLFDICFSSMMVIGSLRHFFLLIYLIKLTELIASYCRLRIVASLLCRFLPFSNRKNFKINPHIL